MRKPLVVIAGLAAALALPAAPAGADVTMSDFRVQPQAPAAGGHPNVTITQALSYDSASDDVKDSFVRLAPGLLGNPQSAAACAASQFAADACPREAVVGSVVVNAKIALLPGLLPTVPAPPVNGVVYNLRPAGPEPARLGFVLEAAGGLSKIFLQAPVALRPGPDGYGLESTFADQPRESGGLNVQIERIALTLNGRASRGSFVRMPTACGPATSVTRANSYEAPSAASQKSFAFTPTNCAALPFAASAEGSVGAPGLTGDREHPPVTTTLRFNPEHAALKRAEVILPKTVAPSATALPRACLRPQANASACPESSRVGTAIIDSPLQARPVRGPVYLALNTPSALPGLMVILPPPVGVRLDGVTELGTFGTKNVFPSNPDLPVRSFTLQFDPGPDSLLQLTRDLCDRKTDTTMEVTLVSHSGKRLELREPLATPGCDPRARVSIRRRGRKARLVARLSAAREGPSITSASLVLPKSLRRGKLRPVVKSGRSRARPLVSRRRLTLPFPGAGVRSARVVWPGLKASRRLKRMARVRVVLKDGREKTTTLRVRARVRGKAPRRS
ncbi:MAG TPA: hypothetical protein VHJ37_08615 [Thermoleophilaceae bacterium]|nr:hypothetical protein [Thermoleophilaceae bacterium]